MTPPPFVIDTNGDRIYEGDYVQCKIRTYDSIRYNERRRVQSIQDGCIVLNNSTSPVGISLYRPDRFRLAGRHHPAHHNAAMRQALDALGTCEDANAKYLQQETITMLHIAILMVPGVDLVDYVNTEFRSPGVIAGRTKAEIQERVKDRITQFPTEKWLICSGNTVAETQSPVIFRSL